MGIAQLKPKTDTQPRVLIVDDEPGLLELIQEIVEKTDCQVMLASNMIEAHNTLCSQHVDLLITDVTLPDGSGLNLLPEMRRLHPDAAAVVITGNPSTEGAVTALRAGAVDFLAKPFSHQQLTDRIKRALGVHQERQRQNTRLLRLKNTVRRLNQARKTVEKKVDLLCNDLVGAYGEVSRQMETVRLQQGFKTFINGHRGLEQLLCHSMDWLLRQLGYCNIGIWLATADHELQLGAYMKYTIPAETELTGAMEKNLLRMAVRRGFIRLREPELKSNLSPIEVKHLGSQDIVVISCTYLGETLGVLALYRDRQTPFSDDDIAALKTVSPLFALALAQDVKGPENEGEGEELHEEKPRKKHKKDPADWWKNGEDPPF
jgi:FixJ family two-component response regulator